MDDLKTVAIDLYQTKEMVAIGTLGAGENHEVFKLEPTAAFVMELAREFYLSHSFTKTFMERLDLSSAMDLLNAVKDSGDLAFTKEMMCDRKFTMRHCLFQQIDLSLEPVQVVILAAGKSPLGLETVHEKNAAVAKVFEIDISSFTEKEKILSALAPALLHKIALIQHDILADDLVHVLKKHGYDEQLKTIPVLVLTSSLSSKDVHEAYRLHANGYLVKPMNPTSYFAIGRAVEEFWMKLVKLPGKIEPPVYPNRPA